MVPRGPDPGVGVAGNEALFQSLGFGRVAGDRGAQTANERHSARRSAQINSTRNSSNVPWLRCSGPGLGVLAYRQRDRSARLRILEPAYTRSPVRTWGCHLTTQLGGIRGSDADSQERGVPILGAVGVIVHETYGQPFQAMRFALGEDSRQGRNRFRAEELSCLHGSLLDGWNGVGGHIIAQGDLDGDSKDGEGSKKEEGGNSETHFQCVIG